MSKNDGKYFEKLVQIIEQSIDPKATIEHDVEMPILKSKKGFKTQCDIVIRKTVANKDVITIVEVQDRTSKIKPNDFRGWIQKVEEVGAQYLICVSRQDFPESIKEKALMSSGKIKLIKLSSIDIKTIPIDFFHYSLTDRHFEVDKLYNLQVIFDVNEQKELGEKGLSSMRDKSINDILFSKNKVDTISLFQLCRSFLTLEPKSKKGTKCFDVQHSKESPFYYIYDNKFYKCGISGEYDWSYTVKNIPVSILSYEQDEHGILAWVLTSVFETKHGKVKFRMPVLYQNGRYTINTSSSEVPDGLSLHFNIHKQT